MTDDERDIAWLRAEFARGGGSPASEAPEPCPPPERIWEAMAGSLGPEETRALVDHIAACAACAEEWRLAVELGAGEKGAERAPRRAEPSAWRKWLPLAATLSAVAAGVSFYELRERPAGTGKPAVRGGIEKIQPLVADGAHLDRDRFVLRWTPAPGALSYTVLVQDAAGQPLTRLEGLTTPRAEVPASVFAGLQASDPVFWLVTTTFTSGAETSTQAWRVLLR